MEKMPLKTFLEAVEQQIIACSVEDLRAILRGMAQETVPAGRASFLQKLGPRVAPTAPEFEIDSDELLGEIADLADELQEAMENAEPDESEEGWYDNDSDEDDEDPYEEFLTPLARLFDQAQAAFDYGNLTLARDAYQALFDVCNEEDDYGRGIQINQIENLDQDESLARYSFAVYSLAPADQRVEQLYDALLQANQWSGKRILFNQVMQISLSPLPDLAAFWPVWIAFLKEQSGADASAWLREAVRLTQGTDGLAVLARAEGMRHPRAYLDWLDGLTQEKQFAQVLTGAQEALQALPKELAIRADIADRLCTAALHLNDTAALRAGGWEAFLANPTLSRLLDVRDATPTAERLAQMQRAAAALQELRARPRGSFYSPGNDDGLADISRSDQTLLAHAMLLGGDWREAHRLAAAEPVLGWSSMESIQGLVLSFFLVWLSGKPSALPAVLAQLWREQLSSVQWIIYDMENNSAQVKRLEATYIDLFGQLSLDADQQESLLEWCVEIANRRVDAIVGGQHRKSYDKAAKLIVACAETLGLRGETPRGRALLSDVRGRFPRHRAFLSELDGAAGKRW